MTHFIRRLGWTALLLSTLLPARLCAQTVRGVVVDQGNRPVAGVVVLLMDATEAAVARTLSSETGDFHVSAARAGTYRLRAMRIGYRPFTSGTVTLAAGQTDAQRLVLANVPLSLDTMKVVARNVCRVDRDSAASTFAVWEQVRTALQATQLTGASRSVMATALNYDRNLDRMGHTVLSQSTTVTTVPAAQPWRSPSADSLRRGGYVVDHGAEATLYFAPSLEVLLSDVFLEDHCFHLKTGKDKSQLGIAFSPASTRKKTAEVSGTLWLDRASAQLRRLEFYYENILAEQQAESGGSMEFVVLRDGAWAISRWNIRMPELVRSVRGDQLTIARIKVNGGELALAMRGGDTLWSRAPLALTGDIVDSVTNRPIAGAVAALSGTTLQGTTDAKGRFSIAGVLPGEYTLEIHTPSLDSMNAAHQSTVTITDGKEQPRLRVPSAARILTELCGITPMTDPGIVAGTVRTRGDTLVPASLRVVAEWTDNGNNGAENSDSARSRTRWRVARTNDRGGYRLCGLPVNTDIVLQTEAATGASGSVEPVRVHLTPASRFARADLQLDRALVRGAVLAGFVYGDTSRRPLADAEIVFPELARHTLSNQRGEFRVRDIPAGSHRVQVRRIGYGPVDVMLTFATNETVDRRVFLSPVRVIDSVVITADRPEPWRAQFEENRKQGFGQFLTRDQLAAKENQSMTSVLQEMRGVTMRVGTAAHAWMSTNRDNIANRIAGGGRIDLDWFHPKADIDLWHNAKPACYADVFVDNVMVFGGRPMDQLFDVSEVNPAQIEAIEYYADHTNIPTRYVTGRKCGVLVIHLRRGK